jgi:hypothetical protein
MVYGDDYRRRRARFHRFRRASTKGNGGLPATGATPPRFPPWRWNRQQGAPPRSLQGLGDGSNRRLRILMELGFRWFLQRWARERKEKSAVLGFPRRRGASCRRQGGGGLHPERWDSSGGSVDWRSSTKLLLSQGRRRRRGKLSWALVAGLLGFGRWAEAR